MFKVIKNGDLFKCGANLLINTVNCVSIMGGGLALIFRNKYPEMYQDYKEMCDQQVLAPGILHLYYVEDEDVTIINLPTKDEVQFDSTPEIVEASLKTLRKTIKKHFNSPDNTLAVPALGCGLGGLDWEDIYPLIEHYLSDLELNVLVFEPR